MPVEFRVMESEPPVDKLKIMLVGPEQNGKSRLAATARKPVLFHDFDNKRESLVGIPGVYVITYVDPQWPKQPTACQDFLTIASKLEESLDLSKLGFKVPEGTYVKTNVIDSIDTYGKACLNYALFGSPQLRREVTFGGHKVFIPGGWDSWKVEMTEVENNVLRLLALPTDTIIIIHETSEQADDSTPENPKYTGRVGVYPARHRALIKYFPEIWRVKLTQSVTMTPNGAKTGYAPRVYPFPNHEFDCGTTLLLDPIEEPNIEAMIAKHELRVKQQSTKTLQQPRAEKSLPVAVKI